VPTCGGDIRLREDGRQEPAHFEPEVRKRAKARMASPAYSQPLTGVGREASKPRERPTGTRSAHPPEAHESLISPKTVAVVPLTGLFLTGLLGPHYVMPPLKAWCSRATDLILPKSMARIRSAVAA